LTSLVVPLLTIQAGGGLFFAAKLQPELASSG
jgi:hypothetical protein